MSNFAIAVKYALKDFFGRQVDHSEFIERTKAGARHYTYWSYDELCLLTVLAGMHKHTFGVPGSIIDAVKAGKWRYDDLKQIEYTAAAIFADTEMSVEGQKRVVNILKQGKNVDPQQFSREDTKILREIQSRAYINKRGHVNY